MVIGRFAVGFQEIQALFKEEKAFVYQVLRRKEKKT